jgi:hypothetical protein
MKTKHTLAIMLLLALPIFSAVVGPASASAAECPGTGEGVVLCSGGHVLEGTVPFTGTQTYFELSLTGWGSPTCSTAKSTGDLVATSNSVEIKNLLIEWSNCKIAGRPSCKVAPILFGSKGTGLTGLITSTSGVTFSPSEGKQYAEIEVSVCEQEVELKVKGSQACSLPNSTVESVTHQVSCTASGSKLTWGDGAATLHSTEEFKLTSGKAFSLQRG